VYEGKAVGIKAKVFNVMDSRLPVSYQSIADVSNFQLIG